MYFGGGGTGQTRPVLIPPVDVTLCAKNSNSQLAWLLSDEGWPSVQRN